MGFVDGIRDIASGVGQLVVGIGKAAFAFLKLALFAVVCVIVGIYSAAKGVFDYVGKTYRKLKEDRPNAKPQEAGSATKKVLIKVLGDIKREVAANTIKLSDFDKKEILENANDIRRKIIRGEANGMHWIEGENEQGEKEVFDAKLIKYDQLSDDDKRRDNAQIAFISNLV